MQAHVQYACSFHACAVKTCIATCTLKPKPTHQSMHRSRLKQTHSSTFHIHTQMHAQLQSTHYVLYVHYSSMYAWEPEQEESVFAYQHKTIEAEHGSLTSLQLVFCMIGDIRLAATVTYSTGGWYHFFSEKAGTPPSWPLAGFIVCRVFSNLFSHSVYLWYIMTSARNKPCRSSLNFPTEHTTEKVKLLVANWHTGHACLAS